MKQNKKSSNNSMKNIRTHFGRTKSSFGAGLLFSAGDSAMGCDVRISLINIYEVRSESSTLGGGCGDGAGDLPNDNYVIVPDA